MSLFKTDPLLALCRLFSWLILASAALGCLFLVCLTLVSLGNWPLVLGGLRQSYPQLLADGLRAPFALGIAVLAVAMGMITRFMLYLNGIIRSVAAGEAFTQLNAKRIRAMAWLSLAGMPVGLFAGAPLSHVVRLLGRPVPDAGFRVGEFNTELGMSHVLMTLLLFVLARLFAQAATMRDELEGTV